MRRGSMLLAMVAAGALLAACGGAAPSGGTGLSGDVHEGGPGAVDGPNGIGIDGAPIASGSGAIELPEGWAGTISAEPLPVSSGTQYLVMGYLYGDQKDATTMSAAQVAGSEFFAGEEVECVGEATLESASSTCMLLGQGLPVEVRLVPAAFGHSALLYSADADGMTDVDISDAAAFGLWGTGGVAPEDATAEDVEQAAANAVSMANHPDGDLPPELAIDCTLSDGGVHAVCEVVGTEGGGGDGTWYATAQPGFPSGSDYLFTQLPA